MEAFTFDVEFGLNGGAFANPQFEASAFGGSDWVSILRDVRTLDPVVLEYGIRGSDPTDRVAEAGELTFALNNGDWNTAQVLGWYSPLHAQRRGGYQFDIPTRLTLVYGGNTIYKFKGKLADVHVEPGAHEGRVVRCAAVDLIDDWSLYPAPAVAAQFDKRGDELVQTVIDALPTDLQPALRSIETGLETYPIAFDDAEEEGRTVLEVVNDICMSGLARAYFVGTPSSPGGLFVFRNRHYSAVNSTVLFTFDNDMARGGLDVPSSRDDIVSRVQVFVHPTRVDAAATTVLFALETTETLVEAGANKVIFGPYRDPANPGDRVGGTEMVTPVATTDYLLNAAQDGSGANLTADLSVVASFTGSGVHFTLTNNGATAGYVTKLQCRGKGIYRFTAVIEKTVSPVYGQRVSQVDMRYQNSVNVGDDVANYLTSILDAPLARVSAVTFLANLSAAKMSAAILREPGNRIKISEDVTGIDEEEFIINGVRLEIRPGVPNNLLWCTWFLEPADMQQYWIWPTTVGVSSVFGF